MQIGVNSCAPVVYAVVDPIVTVVVLILLRISDKSSVCGAYHKFVVGSRLALLIRKKDTLDSQPEVIQFTSCFPMIGSLRVLRLLPPIKVVGMI